MLALEQTKWQCDWARFAVFALCPMKTKESISFTDIVFLPYWCDHSCFYCTVELCTYVSLHVYAIYVNIYVRTWIFILVLSFLYYFFPSSVPGSVPLSHATHTHTCTHMHTNLYLPIYEWMANKITKWGWRRLPCLPNLAKPTYGENIVTLTYRGEQWGSRRVVHGDVRSAEIIVSTVFPLMGHRGNRKC